MDRSLLNAISRMAPDLMDQLISRALILERLSLLQPAGRRQLAQKLGMPEREARVLTNILRADGFIDVTAAGMSLSSKAYEIIDTIRDIASLRTELSTLETQLQKLLNIERVRIVPGNADTNPDVLEEIGRVAGAQLRRVLEPGMILAVNGGTTIHSVATNIPRGANMDVTVLPVRGGLGKSAETQASTLAQLIAERLGGHHEPLYLPDDMPPEVFKELAERMEGVKRTLDELHRANVLLYGIARADEMAKNRLMSPDLIDSLLRQGATAEALGHCFDADGHLLGSASGLGLPEDSFSRIPVCIAVAAGAHKAAAILAVARHHKNTLLITDEGAANRIAELIRKQK